MSRPGVKKSFPRRYRIASLIHKSITTIIPSTINNGIITIRRIELNNELSTAFIFYVFTGEDSKEVALFLTENKEKYRHQLAKKLNMRRTPTLVFMHDEGGLAADKMRIFLDTVSLADMTDNENNNENV